LERDYKAHLETGAPFVRDILIISGGGAKGAFGAGFLQGWESVTGATALPVFDVVTGVSTGALIAPFAFIGTEEAYTSVADFYANPGENWVRKRGLNTMTQSLQLFAMHLLHEIVKDYQETEGMDVEFRWVAIPEDAPKPATTAMFDKDYMLALEDLGRKMGADPSIWKTDVPLVYSFEN